jgi:hypothetical protein
MDRRTLVYRVDISLGILHERGASRTGIAPDAPDCADCAWGNAPAPRPKTIAPRALLTAVLTLHNRYAVPEWPNIRILVQRGRVNTLSFRAMIIT